jgi:hypothetical protein
MSVKKSSKLSLARETLRQLRSSEAALAAGGMRPDTAWTYCDQVPTQCYKPNPY